MQAAVESARSAAMGDIDSSGFLPYSSLKEIKH
jgi:hypothetical protein